MLRRSDSLTVLVRPAGQLQTGGQTEAVAAIGRSPAVGTSEAGRVKEGGIGRGVGQMQPLRENIAKMLTMQLTVTHVLRWKLVVDHGYSSFHWSITSDISRIRCVRQMVPDTNEKEKIFIIIFRVVKIPPAAG